MWIYVYIFLITNESRVPFIILCLYFCFCEVSACFLPIFLIGFSFSYYLYVFFFNSFVDYMCCTSLLLVLNFKVVEFINLFLWDPRCFVLLKKILPCLEFIKKFTYVFFQKNFKFSSFYLHPSILFFSIWKTICSSTIYCLVLPVPLFLSHMMFVHMHKTYAYVLGLSAEFYWSIFLFLC